MRYILAGLFFLILAAPLKATDYEDVSVESVTILASSSLAVPITEISKRYSRAENVDVNAVYEASVELIKSIKEGDPADIVIMPNKLEFDNMKAEGLLDPASIKIIAGNSLSIVAAKELELDKATEVGDIFNKIHKKTLMVIGDPETTFLGHITKQVLEKLGLWPSFAKMVILAPTSTKTIDLIIKGQSAGVVYTTDALLYKDKVVNLSKIPDTMHEPINYYGAVVIGGDMQKARKYLNYLSSKTAKDILKADGFLVK